MTDPAKQTIARWILCAFPLQSNADAPFPVPAPDWETIARCAEENAVAPLLYASLKKCGADAVPPAIVERLRLHYLRADTANWLARQELHSLGAQFERAQIPAVVLKGGVLATMLYPDPALRPMSDLDLLVPLERFARADELVRGDGFTSPVELCDDYAPRLTNYRAYTRGASRNPAHLEIHWHLFKSPYYWRRVPIEWFWEHTTAFHSLQCFMPEAQFLHLAAHFALHHRAERLIWSYDLALFLAREHAVMDWDAILVAAERFGLAPAVQVALARVAETWGVRAPDDVLARLLATRTGWRDRAAFALMNAPRGEARFGLDALSQPSRRAQIEFLWYHLFPSQAYMRERHGARMEKWIPFSYLWRFADGILKFCRSLGSMIISRQNVE